MIDLGKMKKILQKEAPILREICQDVLVRNIASTKIQKIIAEMKLALVSQDDGVAIAAPQIGYPLRIFVVSGKVLNIIKPQPTTEPVQGETLYKSDLYRDSVYINPVLKKVSKEKMIVEEGCLSIRYLYGKVNRSKKATIEACDENGKKFQRGGTGLLSQIFQHEIDHLNGVLFIDKAKYVEEILPQPKKDEGK